MKHTYSLESFKDFNKILESVSKSKLLDTSEDHVKSLSFLSNDLLGDKHKAYTLKELSKELCRHANIQGHEAEGLNENGYGAIDPSELEDYEFDSYPDGKKVEGVFLEVSFQQGLYLVAIYQKTGRVEFMQD